MNVHITSGAIFMLFLTFLLYQIDVNDFFIAQEMVKFHADEAAASGSLRYDQAEFADGFKVYDDPLSNLAIESVIEENFGLDNSLTPGPDSYYQEQFEYYSYFFDDSGLMRTYDNGTFVSQTAFSYGDMFTEPLTGYNKLITEPTVVVTIDAGPARMRFTSAFDIIRTSAYEYVMNN